MASSRANKIGNNYADRLGRLFDAAPKAVIAAVAVSVLTCGGDELEQAEQRFRDEWEILHANGIVAQRAPK